MASFGTIAVDSKAVAEKIPTSEDIYAYKVALTRSDLQRCQIGIDTTERQISIGSDEPLHKQTWDAHDAMLATAEGQAFQAKMKECVEEKPLKLSLTKEVVSVEA